MKIASWNVNGIRSTQKSGFSKWLEKSNIDVVCIQETKAQLDQLTWDLTNIDSYQLITNSAQKKGYSGTAVYTKISPKITEKNLGMKRFDSEGRMIRLDFNDFILINLYVPNGGRNKENMEYKIDFYQELFKYLKKLNGKNIILVGDFNIAHKEIDLARPDENKDNTMFTPEERKQIDNLLDLGFIDTFRHLHKEEKKYSWWAYFRNLRERNIGWRIDYVFISESLRSKLMNSFILKDVSGSDHCPVGIEVTI